MEHIHFVGIGGTGLSAIAKVLLEQGYQVSGSDLTASSLFEGVRDAGGIVFEGHQAENILGADLVIRSSAVPEENPEVQAAIAADIPVLKRSEFLDRLMEGKNVIAIAGSHGKTTTTSMVSWILSEMELDPSFIVGGVVANLGTNARAGSGKDFVIEADEYDHMFLGLEPDLAVITNVEHDHPDVFPTAEKFFEAFRDFVQRLKVDGTLILCGEDPVALRLSSHITNRQKVKVYGFEGKEKQYQARNIQHIPGQGSEFEIWISDPNGDEIYTVSLQLPGNHNVLNATAAFAVIDQLDSDRIEITEALNSFIGSERRFDIRGAFQGITLIDDYAHHPTEIQTTLEAARIVYPEQRIIAVWQPHTYSRSQTMYEGFTRAFKDGDRVIVLDVYAARETRPVNFSIEQLTREIKGTKAEFIPEISQAVDYLKEQLSSGDVLFVFSAGDAIQINDALEGYLSAHAETRIGE